ANGPGTGIPNATNVTATSITLTATHGKIGVPNDAFVIDTSNPNPGILDALAALGMNILEMTGALKILRALATLSGDVILTTHDSAAAGEDIILDSTSKVSTPNGTVRLRAGDNVNIKAGAVVEGTNVFVVGDYGDADHVGTTISILGSITATEIEI